MKVLADKYLQNIDELLPESIELFRYDPDDGLPADMAKYDALLIRTVTQINENTFPDVGNIRFIGTATAGFDHVDIDYLTKKGVVFERSAGCNATAVGEYILTVLFRWASDRGEDLKSKKVGIVGCGHTGSSVLRLLKELNITTVLYDPPKAQRQKTFQSAGIEELLSCDVLTFHTPFTKEGMHPTHHLCGEDWLGQGFDLIVNTSRGGVVDERALQSAHSSGRVRDYILDVWEGEPFFSNSSAKSAFIHTPHIAGYSKEAKWQATAMVVREMCRFFGLHDFVMETASSIPLHSTILYRKGFSEFLWTNSNIQYYHDAFGTFIGLEPDQKAKQFAELRSKTKLRNEFGSILKQVQHREELPEEITIFL